MTNTAPFLLRRPVVQDPDARLMDLARWHDRLVIAMAEASHVEEQAHKGTDKQALESAGFNSRALANDWRAIRDEAADTTPRTLLGFALKIRILAEDEDDWWTTPADEDIASGKARAILQQILSVAGVCPPSRSTFRLAQMLGEAPTPPPGGHEPTDGPAGPVCPVERLGRRYGALAAEYARTEAAGTLDEMAAIEQAATVLQPTSLAGAMFLMLRTWDEIADLARDLPEGEDRRLDPIRRMIAAAVDCLEQVVGVSGDDLGRQYTGPGSGSPGPEPEAT